MGTRRSFWGVVKDKATNNPSNLDAWRVTYYDTGGNYVGRAIDIPLGTGVVNMPQSRLTAGQIEGRESVGRDVAATVETVVALVCRALRLKGIAIEPQELLDLVEPGPDSGE